MKKNICVILVLASLLLLTGCDDTLSYKGTDVDLNTEAANSILGFAGFDSNKIVVMEEDSFGRKMFINYGPCAAANDRVDFDRPTYVYGILISQKTEGGFVYYYPDDNVIVYPVENAMYGISAEKLSQYVHDWGIEEDVEALMQKNDWGKPLDESKCVRVKVSRRTRDYASRPPLVSDADKKAAYEQAADGQDGSATGAFYYLTSDDFDRHIYFFRGVRSDKKYTKSYVVMFNKDGSFDPVYGIMEISDLWHYQNELKTFKENGGWNTP